MKKIFAVAAAVTVLLWVTPVCADQGISTDDNGSRTALFKDTLVDQSTIGNVVQVAGDVEIQESLDGNVVAVMGDITISAPVTGDVVAILGNVRLAKGAQVQGDIVTVIGNTELPGAVYGDVVTIAGNTGIESRIGGDVVSLLGATALEAGTDIEGDILSLGSFHKDSKVRIAGREMAVDLGAFSFQEAAGAAGPVFLLLTGIFSVFLLLSGLVLTAVAARWTLGTALGLEGNLWRKAGIGFLVFLGFLLVQLLLFITIIAPLAFIALLLVASILSCLYAGSMLCKRLHIFCSPVLQFVCGFMVLTLVKLLLIAGFIMTGWSLLAGAYLLLILFIHVLGIGSLVDRKSLTKTTAGTGRV